MAFMQQFTEFMELFLSVRELIKTLNLYSVCLSARTCPPPAPLPAGHKVFPRSPGAPRSCSAVRSVGVLGPTCSELEVSARTASGRSQHGAWPTGHRSPEGRGPARGATHQRAWRGGRRAASARPAVSAAPSPALCAPATDEPRGQGCGPVLGAISGLGTLPRPYLTAAL